MDKRYQTRENALLEFGCRLPITGNEGPAPVFAEDYFLSLVDGLDSVLLSLFDSDLDSEDDETSEPDLPLAPDPDFLA
jgi:hypothetical protein